jgi:hypothetical protein
MSITGGGVVTTLPGVRDHSLEVTFLAGLAGVFIVNALTALLQPVDFTGLVAGSVFGRWLGIGRESWLSALIALNDLALGLALLGAIRVTRIRPLVLAWAGVWLLAVSAIKVTSLEAFPW